ncbi:hypothetical protein VNI00_002121 [Paramarasmius palmivorus]|uniref:F-box domain-containing protein n=1 Tax=Paramarasmius palmivorus TaxID=297713 RepID=A0AAW0E3X6_9AGAR
MFLCQKCQTSCLDNMPPQHGPRSVDIIQALRSNVLPSPMELSQMQALERAERSELEQVEETIMNVRDTLKELENRKDTLRQEIQFRGSWLAPIRRLPTEVLKEIFTHVCSGSGSQHERKFKYSLDISSEVERDYCPFCVSEVCGHSEVQILRKITVTTPLSLSQVCAHWRSVTIGTPSLWASLRLDAKRMDKGHASLVDLYLQRSAQYPLKIALVAVDGVGYVGGTGYEVLCSVVKELDRCREFHYDSDKYILINLIPEASRPKALPLLTAFSDRLKDVDPRGGWLWDSVKVAPNLVDVSVERFRPDSFPANLRNLTINGQRDYTLFLETLPQLPNLVSLNLKDFSVRETTPPPPPATPHPIHTRNLMITSAMTLSSLDPLFSSVSLPFLSSLEISTHWKGISDLRALCALIRRSGCSLKDLTLRIGSYSSSDLISLLELQPSLVGLNLEVRVPRTASGSESELSPEPLVLVNLFTGMLGLQSPLLPCVQRLEILERVRLTDQRFTEVAVSALDVVELRERKGEFIPNISLTFKKDHRGGSEGRCLPVDLEKRAKELTERGVECRIVFPSELRIGNWR